MANTYTLLGASKGINFIRNTGTIFAVVTLNDTYASTLGGLTLDFSTLYTAASPNDMTIAHADVVAVTGRTTVGYQASFTKLTTAGQWTMTLWNGTTQHTEASQTGTLNAILYVAM